LRLQVIHAKDFLRMTPEGKIDFEKTRDMLLEAVSVEGLSSELDVLVDFRHVESDLSPTDVWYLAEELSKHDEAFKDQIAILVNPERFDNAKFFELCALNRGLEVAAFSSYEDAINWLFPSSDVPSRETQST
jgi:hypothetical protein